MPRLNRWWRSSFVAGVDHDHVLRQISDEAGWSGRYAFLIVISAAISLLGLLMPSVAVLIGAMLLSPLMMPIIGLGFAIATLDFREMRLAATALVLGSIVAVLLSVVLVTISPVQTVTSEIANRTQPTLFDLLVALLSAIAGGYALIRGRGGTVVGVAIAIALMPPLVVVGFGIATWNATIFSGALLLFMTNAVTIALTAALIARVYGFGRHLSPSHTGWQLILFVLALGILSIPLGASLKQIALEAVVQRQTREVLRANFPDGARMSLLEIDQTTRPMRIRAVVLTPQVAPGADDKLTAALEVKVGRKVDLHVDQVRISPASGTVEGAQLARASEQPRSSTSDERDKAVADLALIAGVDPSEVRVDAATRRLDATPVPLPGLTIAGYRALENRARDASPGWQVHMTPPADIELPALRIEDGVVDNTALDLAAWASARLDRTVIVNAATARQRDAISKVIVSRNGKATPADGRGNLGLVWAPDTLKSRVGPDE